MDRFLSPLSRVAFVCALSLSSACAATFTVINTNSSGAGSLFQAITDANGLAGPDTVVFNILPTGPKTITVPSSLAITDPVTIDGTTQPGFAGSPTIELVGQQNIGFFCLGGSNTIRGFAMSGFNSAVYFYIGSSSNRLEGCWIGLDLNGARRTNSQGVQIYSSQDNVIGGTNAAARNVISGSIYSGIYVYDGSHNQILGNYIGTDVSGSNSVGNGFPASGGWNDAGGIYLESSVSNIIGGTVAAARNVISCNAFGIVLFTRASANTIQGNWIGLNAGGTAAPVGRRQITGIRISVDSNGNLIGGTDPGSGNVISGNSGTAPLNAEDGLGIQCNGSGLNVIQGNFIGTDASGTAPVGNNSDGIFLGGVSRTNTIGGTTAAARNVISANRKSGIQLRDAQQNIIQGNFIGTASDGVSALGNGESGIYIYSGSGNQVGGPPTSAGNVIAFNGTNASLFFRHGIAVAQLDQFTPSTGNSIRRNSIFSNVERGILLYDLDCSTCVGHNDLGDADSGPNNLQNTPVLTNATTSGGSIAVSGRFNSKPNSTYTVEFFADPELDPSGYGEGKKYIGQAAVVTDGSGNTGFEAFFLDSGYSGQFISATATDASGNTSEFGPDVAADAPAGVIQFRLGTVNYPEDFFAAQIEVVRLGGDGSPVTVHYSMSDGTAIAGSDYVSTNGTLIFGAGENSKSIEVRLLDNSLNELNETAFITLDSPTGGAVLGVNRTNTLVITDNDYILLNAGDAGATKPASGSTTINFPITITQPSIYTVAVHFATANITALAGIDYQATNGTLLLAPGVTNATIPVIVFADGVQEGSKSFVLTLSSPTNAVFGDSSALGTIYDGTQGVLQFSAAAYTNVESAGSATITVTRTGGTLGTVSVPFSASAGSATAGSDFTPTNGVLTFNNGQGSRSFSVALLDDGLPETNETVLLQLGAPTGTSLGSLAAAVLTLQDNDVAPMLSIRAIAGGVALRWPTQVAGFQLFSRASLSVTNWNPVTNVPVIEGAELVVTNSTVLTNRFYRLEL